MSADALGAALRTVLASRGLRAGEVTRLRRLSGGAVQETWGFDVAVDGTLQAMVLRRAPSGAAVLEDRVISLPAQARLCELAATWGVPTPPVVAVLKPEDDLGAGFVMGHVSGQTIPRRIQNDPALAGVRPHLARRCGEVLARIHAAPTGDLPELAHRPAPLRLDELRRQYDAQRHPRPVFELAFQWLRRRLPVEPAPTLVHGDFRNGNLIIGPEGLAAVIDWERAYLGDPMGDVGLLCTPSWRFGRMELPVGGLGGWDAFAKGYAEVAGQPPDAARAKFWTMFGSLDWGVTAIGFAQTSVATGGELEHAAVGRRASEVEVDILEMVEGRFGW